MSRQLVDHPRRIETAPMEGPPGLAVTHDALDIVRVNDEVAARNDEPRSLLLYEVEVSSVYRKPGRTYLNTNHAVFIIYIQPVLGLGNKLKGVSRS